MKRKTYWFGKYYPPFRTGDQISEFDYVEFKNWKPFIKKYTKEFPLMDGFKYAFSKDNERYWLVAVSKQKKVHWLVGKTDVNLSRYYKDWKYLLNKEDFE